MRKAKRIRLLNEFAVQLMAIYDNVQNFKAHSFIPSCDDAKYCELKNFVNAKLVQAFYALDDAENAIADMQDIVEKLPEEINV